jgi:hypothetical protein
MFLFCTQCQKEERKQISSLDDLKHLEIFTKQRDARAAMDGVICSTNSAVISMSFCFETIQAKKG